MPASDTVSGYKESGRVRRQCDCIRKFSEAGYTAYLKEIDRNTLIVHGDDDQIVSIEACDHRTAEIVKNATLTVYEGDGHCLAQLQVERFITDVLSFIQE